MFKVALAGLGTVGSAVVRQLKENANLIAERAGQAIVLKAVSARQRSKTRDCDLEGTHWFDNPLELALQNDIQCVIELIGGAEGPALRLADATLDAKKHLVTANKAMLAADGPRLARQAEKQNVGLCFEAAVVGGVPIIKTLRESCAGDQILRVRGILNGTCNSILSRMRDAQLSFSDALLEAQKKGYAEADPNNDIDGHDTANKLALLASLAFGTIPDLATVTVEGIRNVTALDLKFAEDLGCRVKLLGVARWAAGGLEQRVGPCLVPEDQTLATIDGALNAVYVRGRAVGDLTLVGQGAGGAATANAVIADLIDLARGNRVLAFARPAGSLSKPKIIPPQPARYYLRLDVIDKPGVVADISAILRDEMISIESLLQRSQAPGNTVPVVITTHLAEAEKMKQALQKISELSTVRNRPCLMPIED